MEYLTHGYEEFPYAKIRMFKIRKEIQERLCDSLTKFDYAFSKHKTTNNCSDSVLQQILKEFYYSTGKIVAYNSLSYMLCRQKHKEQYNDKLKWFNDIVLKHVRVFEKEFNDKWSQKRENALYATDQFFKNGIAKVINEEAENLKFLLDTSLGIKTIETGSWTFPIKTENFDKNFIKKYFQEKEFNVIVEFENAISNIRKTNNANYDPEKLVSILNPESQKKEIELHINTTENSKKPNRI